MNHSESIPMPGISNIPRLFFHAALLATALTLTPTAALADPPTSVYSSNYDDPKNLALWSKPRVESIGGHTVLGRFSSLSQALTLANLPPHSFLRLRTQIVIMGSKDAAVLLHSPDVLSIRLDGRTLLHASFSILSGADPRKGRHEQSYPDNYGDVLHEGLTGSAAGKVDWLPNPGGEWPAYGVYEIEFTLPHAEETLRVSFTGSHSDGDDSIDDQSWGLGHVEVAVMDGTPTTLDRDSAARLMSDLAGEDAVRAGDALRTLISAGDGALPWIKQNVEAAKLPVRARIKSLISKLEDESFTIRESAEKDLINCGNEAILDCQQAVDGGASPEGAVRLRHIMAEITDCKPSLYDLRIRRLLEIIGTPQARLLCRSLFPANLMPTLPTIRQTLEISDTEEWSAISEEITIIRDILESKEVRAARQDALEAANTSREMAEVRDLTEANVVVAVRNISDALRDLRQKHYMKYQLAPATQRALRKAQEELQSRLRMRNDANLVLMNILE
jgi:hypothetical protein